MRRLSAHRIVLPTALAFLAFTLRLYRLSYQSLWRDETDVLRFATQPLTDLLSMFRSPGQNGPLYFLTLRPWLAATGHSEFALRFPSALAGALAVPMIYILVARLAGRKVALLAGLLAAVAPYLVWYGQDAKMYALLTLLVPLALWLTLRVRQDGRWWRWVLLYLVTSLSVYYHLLAALVIPVEAVWLLLAPAAAGQVIRPAQRAGSTATYLAALCLPYLPLLGWQTQMLTSGYSTGHAFVALPQIVTVLAAAFSRGILAVRWPITIWPTMLALVAGAALWATGSAAAGRWRVVALLMTWLVLPPLLVFAISLRMPIFLDRYLIWAMPAFLALVALGVAALWTTWRPLGAVIFVALLGLNGVSLVAQSSQPIKSDFRQAASFVMARHEPEDLLVFQIPYSRYTFTYYAGNNWRWLDGPYTNDGSSPAMHEAQLAAGTKAARHVWLIASETALWDERHLAERWLEQNGTVLDRADFTLVSVARYELQGNRLTAAGSNN